MTGIQILKITCALATLATGFISLIKPRSVKGFIGLDVTIPRGLTEVRAVLGGLFIGLGTAPFIQGVPVPAVYQALAIALFRPVQMFLDKSVVQSNIISLVVEVNFGIILMLQFFFITIIHIT